MLEIMILLQLQLNLKASPTVLEILCLWQNIRDTLLSTMHHLRNSPNFCPCFHLFH